MTGAAARHALIRDPRGMLWDALLYVPTVSALGVFAVSSWYDDKVPVAYVLGFLACFFLFAGANRILTTRLMWLPGAPVAIDVGDHCVDLVLRSGRVVSLRRELKLYREKTLRTFGLTGLNEAGRRCQFVFHRGQFRTDSDFQAVMSGIDRAAAPRG